MYQISTITQNPRNQDYKMKYLEKDTKLIPFLEDWSWDNEEKWRFFERDTMSLRDINRQDNEQTKMFEGKLKGFKNCP